MDLSGPGIDVKLKERKKKDPNLWRKTPFFSKNELPNFPQF
jgi:hypothetical protein